MSNVFLFNYFVYFGVVSFAVRFTTLLLARHSFPAKTFRRKLKEIYSRSPLLPAYDKQSRKATTSWFASRGSWDLISFTFIQFHTCQSMHIHYHNSHLPSFLFSYISGRHLTFSTR